MANEINVVVGATLNVTAIGLKHQTAVDSYQMDQATPNLIDTTVTIPTSDTVVDLSALADPGLVIIRNLDSANFVDYGPESAGALVPMGRLEAGKPAQFVMAPGVVLRMLADTGSVAVHIAAYDR